MEFGICVASRPADLEYVVEAERLGFTHCWMADSQMIWSDVYAMLALAAERTTTMRLGTGVAVAGTRPSSVTAAALATINELAPGRVFCGIGSGNTATLAALALIAARLLFLYGSSYRQPHRGAAHQRDPAARRRGPPPVVPDPGRRPSSSVAG